MYAAANCLTSVLYEFTSLSYNMNFKMYECMRLTVLPHELQGRYVTVFYTIHTAVIFAWCRANITTYLFIITYRNVH